MFNLFKKSKKQQAQKLYKSDENWVKVMDKAFKDYSSLSQMERIWYNLRVLIDAINNGGLISYYYNSGAEHVYETIDDLRFLQMDSFAEMIEQYNSILFPDSKVPADLTKRNEVINVITDDIDAKLQDIDLRIIDLSEEIDIELAKYLRR